MSISEGAGTVGNNVRGGGFKAFGAMILLLMNLALGMGLAGTIFMILCFTLVLCGEQVLYLVADSRENKAEQRLSARKTSKRYRRIAGIVIAVQSAFNGVRFLASYFATEIAAALAWTGLMGTGAAQTCSYPSGFFYWSCAFLLNSVLLLFLIGALIWAEGIWKLAIGVVPIVICAAFWFFTATCGPVTSPTSTTATTAKATTPKPKTWPCGLNNKAAHVYYCRRSDDEEYARCQCTGVVRLAWARHGFDSEQEYKYVCALTDDIDAAELECP